MVRKGKASAAHGQTTRQLLKTLYVTTSGLLMLIAAAAGAITLVLGGQASASGFWRGFWIAIGTGLVVTALYSFFAALLLRDQLERTVGEVLRSELQSHEDALLERIERHETWYLPSKEWEETEQPDVSFNRRLNQAIKDSEKYSFQGITAKTSIARLACLSNSRLYSAVFLLAHPVMPESILKREFREIDDDHHRERRKVTLMDEVKTSLVGAHLVRRRIPNVTVVLQTEPPLDRSEVLDSCVFISLFSLRSDETMPYPPSAVFDKKTYAYRDIELTCTAFAESGYTHRIRITQDMDVTEFIGALREQDIEMTEEEYEIHEQAFKDKVIEVRQQLASF